jgi:hypothetical protein
VDIINATTVTMHAKVNHWIEADDDGIQEAMYWRQGFDIRSKQLSVSQDAT